MKQPWKRGLFLIVALALLSGGPPPLHSQQGPAKDVRLVLLVAVDQFRYDYLTRFRSEYNSGLDRLLRSGANYVNAHLDHYPTVTAIGHSTMFSGATPKVSGIVGNDWYDREEGGEVTSVSDKSVQLLGGTPGAGASPRRLLVSTVGDELKRAGRAASKVIGISFKDRGAILPAGHMADAAYWFDSDTGTFVSSTYYFPTLPAWVEAFNGERPADQYAGATWKFGAGATDLLKFPIAPGPKLFDAVYASTFGNELLERFAEAVVRREKLGQRDVTDVLTVSFSSNDAVGHKYGPDSAQVHAISVQTDRVLGELFDYLESAIGMQRVLVVLTADHGVMPMPEQLEQSRMPGGRFSSTLLFDTMQEVLTERFGAGKWVEGTAGTSPYFDRKLVAEKGLAMSEVERVAAQSVEYLPHVARVFTRTQLLEGQAPGDLISQRVARSFNPRRSGDLEILLDPYWIRSRADTTHGTPYSYDSHIPLIFWGPGIQAGTYVRPVTLNDLAPSLATLLEIETPSGSQGRALYEMMTFAADR
jgi:predicted AlkP superfamily pyrophosphatase or phosphodiesterase